MCVCVCVHMHHRENEENVEHLMLGGPEENIESNLPLRSTTPPPLIKKNKKPSQIQIRPLGTRGMSWLVPGHKPVEIKTPIKGLLDLNMVLSLVPPHHQMPCTTSEEGKHSDACYNFSVRPVFRMRVTPFQTLSGQ